VRHSQVFSTSQCIIPPLSVPALFHAGSTPGVFPFRVFPSLESESPLSARSPPDIPSRSPSNTPWQATKCWNYSVRLSSGVCSSSESVHTMSSVNPNIAAATLLVFLPPRVSHDSRWVRLHGPSSHALQSLAHQPRKPGSPASAPQSITQRAVWLVSKETAVLPGFFTLVTLHTLDELPAPWLIVSPRTPEYVAIS
jgi:hypothetical protein